MSEPTRNSPMDSRPGADYDDPSIPILLDRIYLPALDLDFALPVAPKARATAAEPRPVEPEPAANTTTEIIGDIHAPIITHDVSDDTAPQSAESHEQARTLTEAALQFAQAADRADAQIAADFEGEIETALDRDLIAELDADFEAMLAAENDLIAADGQTFETQRPAAISAAGQADKPEAESLLTDVGPAAPVPGDAAESALVAEIAAEQPPLAQDEAEVAAAQTAADLVDVMPETAENRSGAAVDTEITVENSRDAVDEAAIDSSDAIEDRLDKVTDVDAASDAGALPADQTIDEESGNETGTRPPSAPDDEARLATAVQDEPVDAAQSLTDAQATAVQAEPTDAAPPRIDAQATEVQAEPADAAPPPPDTQATEVQAEPADAASPLTDAQATEVQAEPADAASPLTDAQATEVQAEPADAASPLTDAQALTAQADELSLAVLEAVTQRLPEHIDSTVRDLMQPAVDEAIARLGEEAQVALRISLQQLVEQVLREELARRQPRRG